jgi:hypothetical protein
VSVIEPQQTKAGFIVKGERVTEAMRTLHGGCDFFDYEFDPVLAVRICDETFAIEKEERV